MSEQVHDDVCECCQDTGMEYATANSDGDDFMRACDNCDLGKIIRYAVNGCNEMNEETYDPYVLTESKCGTFQENVARALAAFRKRFCSSE